MTYCAAIPATGPWEISNKFATSKAGTLSIYAFG